MSPSQPREERRHARSENVQTALELQLLAAARQGHFRTIVLADELGLTVAGAGTVAAQERLAAVAPRLVGQTPTFHKRVGKAQQMLTVTTLRTNHGDLYLAAVGGESETIPKVLFCSGRGVSRILGAWQ